MFYEYWSSVFDKKHPLGRKSLQTSLIAASCVAFVDAAISALSYHHIIIVRQESTITIIMLQLVYKTDRTQGQVIRTRNKNYSINEYLPKSLHKKCSFVCHSI